MCGTLHALLLYVSSGAVFTLNLCDMQGRKSWNACKNGRSSLIVQQTVYKEQLINTPAMLNMSFVCFNVAFNLDDFKQRWKHVKMYDIMLIFSCILCVLVFINLIYFTGYFTFIVPRKVMFKYLSINKNLMTAINFGVGQFSHEPCSTGNQATGKLDRSSPSARGPLCHVWGLLITNVN